MKIFDVNIFKNFLVFDVFFNEIFFLSGLLKVFNIFKEFYVFKNEIIKIEEIEYFYGL